MAEYKKNYQGSGQNAVLHYEWNDKTDKYVLFYIEWLY